MFNRKLTEEKVIRILEREFSLLDWYLQTRAIDQIEYDEEIARLQKWAENCYVEMSK